MIIFAESTTGKTRVARDNRQFLDQDQIWEKWLADNNIDGWRAVENPAILEKFRMETFSEFLSAMDQGAIPLIWDVELAKALQKARGDTVRAVIVKYPSDYAYRTLERFRRNEKRRNSIPTTDALRRTHLQTRRLLDQTCWPKYELTPGQYLSDVINQLIQED